MKEIKPKVLLKLDRMPFYVGILNPNQKPKLPAVMPFYLYVDERLAIPRLVRTRVIEKTLELAYSLGSMLSTPLGESPLSNERMAETIAVLREKSGGTFEGKRYVEVGAGNGALLNAIREYGAEVIGFEIGPQAEEARRRFDLTMVQGELAPKHLPRKVDCIFSYGCLEHIYEPHEFIDVARELLVPGGLFFHRVPNSMLLFKTGDIEGLCHEHVNYFTPENAVRLLAARGFVNCGAEPTKAGNELNIWGYANPDAMLSWPGDILSELTLESELLHNFSKIVEKKVSHQVERIRSRVLRLKGGKLGFYAGGHILASLADVSKHSRFFDGDETKWGKCWLHGLPPIEPPSNLRSDSVDVVIVCREHYFMPIHTYLRETVRLSEAIKIIPISDV